MKPRASASFCHCPKLTSTPPGHVGPSCVSSPSISRSTTSAAPARSTATDYGRLIVEPRHIADADGMARLKLEAEEILERAGEALAPVVGGNARQIHAVDQDAALRRLIQATQQFHQRALAGAVLADDRNDGAGVQLEVDVVEHFASGARIRERHVVETNAAAQPFRHRARRRSRASDAA